MRVLWITALTILIDQAAKLVVVREMYLGQSIPLIGDWFRLTYTTNPGMAFGINFGPRGLVTVLSLLATGLIIAYLYKVRDGYTPYLASLALILGGAVGNIIDRVFYGVIYNQSTFFTGEVVDFIHFNVWRGYLPTGIPGLGGSYVALFPIWNMADMAIVCGVAGIMVFQNRFHAGHIEQAQAPEGPVAEPRIDGTPDGGPVSVELPEQSIPASPMVYRPPVEQDQTYMDDRRHDP